MDNYEILMVIGIACMLCDHWLIGLFLILVAVGVLR